MTQKNLFKTEAVGNGVIVSYSGKTNTMFVKGDQKKVNSFVSRCNLRGKSAFPFNIKKG